MRIRVCIGAVLLVASVALAQTAPAPIKPDYSTPKAALKTYAQAVVAQDAALQRQSMVIDPADKPIVDAVLAATESAARLQKSVRAKFGDAAVAELRSPGAMELKMAAWLKLLEVATAENSGDSKITLTFPDSPDGSSHGGSVTLLAVDKQWKVAAGSLLNLSDPATAAKLKQGIPLFTGMAAAYNEVAADVDAGKHPTLKSAQDSLMEKVTAVARSQKSAATQK